jgi:hypothetical protein
MDKFDLPDRTAQYKRINGDRYLVLSFQGVFEAATTAIGHGVSKVHYVCPDNEHTNNVFGEYPRVMTFSKDPHNNYCALVTSCINETQLNELQKHFM